MDLGQGIETRKQVWIRWLPPLPNMSPSWSQSAHSHPGPLTSASPTHIMLGVDIIGCIWSWPLLAVAARPRSPVCCLLRQPEKALPHQNACSNNVQHEYNWSLWLVDLKHPVLALCLMELTPQFRGLHFYLYLCGQGMNPGLSQSVGARLFKKSFSPRRFTNSSSIILIMGVLFRI